MNVKSVIYILSSRVSKRNIKLDSLFFKVSLIYDWAHTENKNHHRSEALKL